MSDKVKCSVCSKEVSKQTMAVNADLFIAYSGDGDLRKSAGPYAGSVVHICYECWFRSMGVKTWMEKECRDDDSNYCK